VAAGQLFVGAAGARAAGNGLLVGGEPSRSAVRELLLAARNDPRVPALEREAARRGLRIDWTLARAWIGLLRRKGTRSFPRRVAGAPTNGHAIVLWIPWVPDSRLRDVTVLADPIAREFVVFTPAIPRGAVQPMPDAVAQALLQTPARELALASDARGVDTAAFHCPQVDVPPIDWGAVINCALCGAEGAECSQGNVVACAAAAHSCYECGHS
jgi:hypothetical protein